VEIEKKKSSANELSRILALSEQVHIFHMTRAKQRVKKHQQEQEQPQSIS
jgi:hypothetical protein